MAFSNINRAGSFQKTINHNKPKTRASFTTPSLVYKHIKLARYTAFHSWDRDQYIYLRRACQQRKKIATVEKAKDQIKREKKLTRSLPSAVSSLSHMRPCLLVVLIMLFR